MLESPSLSPHQLEEAFAAFTRASLELDASYQALQGRVAALTAELAEARSERLRELAEKERLAHRLALLMAALPGGVVVLDQDGGVKEANPEASALMAERLCEASWAEIFCRAATETGKDGQELILHGGRRLSLTRRALPGGDESVILLTDVTEVHALQEAVNREQRLSAMGEMAARLAHQVRTPLSSALLYLSQLTGPSMTNTARRRIAAKVLERLRHMDALVNSMLTFVRGEPAGTESIALGTLLAGVLEVIAPMVAHRGGTLRTCASMPAIAIKGNREALSSALLSLAGNAVEASGEGVSLSVAVELDDDSVVFAVGDNGPGVPVDLRERIFDPFFTTRSQGTGLGLAVVAMVAKAHGGRVWVEDGAAGGALFKLQLPRVGAGWMDPGAGLWMRSAGVAASVTGVAARASRSLLAGAN
jgi:two-component system sensor histidine kinase FlrB